MDYDVVVVGAGVVGLACAQRLSRAGRRVLVVERHSAFGQETSSRNSEVIHAGMYYPTGSDKARLCVKGREQLYSFCERYQVAHRKVGKYIIAVDDSEVARLSEIRARAIANGVGELAWVDRAQLRVREPEVRAVAALWSADTGILDSHEYMARLSALARESSCDFAYAHRVIQFEPDSILVAAPDSTRVRLRAARWINSAGLSASSVAQRLGHHPENLTPEWVKGSYVRVCGPIRTRSLVYPVPLPALQGLGIHVTLDLAGGMRLGPDAELVPIAANPESVSHQSAPHDYAVSEALVPRFHRAVSRYLPNLRASDLSPDQAGIRPKLRSAGGPVDFVIRRCDYWIHLLGIESPGLTASLAIAERVEELCD